MREALAHSDHDFVIAEPRRRKPQSRRGFIWLLAALVRLMFRLAAYPNRILGGLVFALVVAILVNALLLQHSRHPAPLFHRSVTADVQWPAAQSAQEIARAPLSPVNPAPSEAPKPAGNDQIGLLLKTEAPAQPAPPNQQAAPAPQPANHDAIAHLLTAPAPHEATRAAVTETTGAHETATQERPKTVLAVQRALIKLGYVVKPDGEMGAVTRHALAQYERDHGLPVDPHFSAKLLHRLSAETGLTMD